MSTTNPNDLYQFTSSPATSNIWSSLVEDHPREVMNAGRKAMVEALEQGLDLTQAISTQLAATVNGAGTGRMRGAIELMLDVVQEYQKAGQGFNLTIREDMSPGVKVLLSSLTQPPEMLRATLSTIPSKDGMAALGALAAVVISINERVGGIQIQKREVEGKKATVKAKVSTRTSGQKAGRKQGMPKLSYGQVVKN